LSRERYQQNKLTTEAELRALRAQVNPHFLFNALNTIGYLIQASPARAHETLMKLTSLLRGVLRSADAATTLGDEIDLVSAYLEIERARFDERLCVAIDVPRELRAIRVPALMIQPLVENAIKHGIANCRTGGRVAIESRSDGENLTISVRNSGARVTDADIARGRQKGMGLSNLDARLRHQYGDAASLTLVATADETRAEIVLPIARRA
jgi:LytS/YehU family sensor histidine kinase